jgi:hypothetical protein
VPFSDDVVIRRISENFVPVALNLYTVRPQKDAAGDFFRSVQKQKPNYQGFWIATAEGKVIAAHQDFKDHNTWTQEVLELLDRTLKGIGPLPLRSVKPADPLPHRGVGLQPDGRHCLAMYFCVLYGGKRVVPPSLDSILLTPAEMAALAPATLEAGAESVVAESVARQFCRAISASRDTSWMPGPQDVTKVELKAKVEAVEGGQARVRLVGSWEAVKIEVHDVKKRPTYSSSSAEGLLTIDLRKRSPVSLLMVFGGTWRNVAPYDAPVTSAAVVEWKAK